MATIKFNRLLLLRARGCVYIDIQPILANILLETNSLRFFDHWPNAVLLLGVLLSFAWVGALIWIILRLTYVL